MSWPSRFQTQIEKENAPQSGSTQAAGKSSTQNAKYASVQLRRYDSGIFISQLPRSIIKRLEWEYEFDFEPENGNSDSEQASRLLNVAFR